ncbi:hypothetical protein BH23CHL2_BH23CHL2_15880 [soil metagenome]
MARNGRHRRRKGDPKLILHLARGLAVSDAADEAGVSTRTAFRRLEDGSFRDEVRQQRTQFLDQVIGGLAGASLEAVNTLVELLEAESEMARLGAARCILDNALKFREQGEIVGRIEDLEQTLVITGARRV